jgi:hypothetical protein
MTLRLSSSPSAPTFRAIVRLLVGAQILLGMPVPPAAAEPRVFEPGIRHRSRSTPSRPQQQRCYLRPRLRRSWSRRTPRECAPAANRHLPAFAPPARAIAFSRTPTAEEIFRARVLPEPLVPIVDDPSPDETAALARAVEAYARAGRPDQTAPFEAFLDAHPRSAWRAAVLANLAGVLTRGAFSRPCAHGTTRSRSRTARVDVGARRSRRSR